MQIVTSGCFYRFKSVEEDFSSFLEEKDAAKSNSLKSKSSGALSLNSTVKCTSRGAQGKTLGTMLSVFHSINSASDSVVSLVALLFTFVFPSYSPFSSQVVDVYLKIRAVVVLSEVKWDQVNYIQYNGLF